MSSPGLEPCDFAAIEREERPQAERLAWYLSAVHRGQKILDVGCAHGLYVEEMRKMGLQAYGVDNDPRLVESDFLFKQDITGDPHLPSECPIDIVLSLEVGEHIPEELATLYVQFIAHQRPSLVYFSAARPGQGGQGHVNCQPKSYWTRRFAQSGYFVDPEATENWLGYMRNGYHMGWLVQNGILFRRF